MDKTSSAIAATIGLSVLGVVGDYFLKRSSNQSMPFTTALFLIGLAIYSSAAFGWVFVMRELKLATLGVIYASATVLQLTLMLIGVVVFNESLKWQEWVGIALAILSLCLLARFA